MKRIKFILPLIFACFTQAFAQNPVVPSKGVNDPHIHIFNNKAYLYASHDREKTNKTFIMDDWWAWSSDDLTNWKLESTLNPKDTYIGKDFTGCWATDVAYKNGKYYWYFSEKNEQTGVVVGDSPTGPWKDVLKKPFLDSTLTPTHEYDIALIEDKGVHYVVFGVWDYYIARLNDDMISLAEKPRKIILNNPYGPYGKGKTDDKPSVHKYKDKFYLSWGCFYGMSDNVYGPYDYKGAVMDKSSFSEGYDKPTWPNGFLQGRHGNYFEWNNQWYFTYCDISQTGNRYFRDAFISYLSYKDNGEMSLIRVDGTGVNNYDANQKIIEAEDYSKASKSLKKECPEGGFMVNDLQNNDYLTYQNVKGLDKKSKIDLRIANTESGFVELRDGSSKGKLFAKFPLKRSIDFRNISFNLPKFKEKEHLCFVFKGKGKINFNAFSFQ
jgi:arabinoxylan arabinofuranohydrolase